MPVFTEGELQAVRWWATVALLLIAAAWAQRAWASAMRLTPAMAAELSAVDGRLEASRQLDLNSADVAALEALPGIGRVTAERIIAHRRACGPFAVVDGLAQVPGIAPGVIDRIRAFVTVHTQGGG